MGVDVLMDTWKEQALSLANTGAISWRQISRVLKVPKSSVSDYLRANSSQPQVHVEDAKGHDNSRILVISDLHAPFCHPKAIEFLAGLKAKYNPTRIISVGDEVDRCALSYHENNPDLPSAGDELKAAKKVITQLHNLFPEMDIMESNHGSLHLRKAMTAGIPKAYMKDYGDILGVGKGWCWHHDMIIDLPNGQQCYFTHGKSANGLKLSQSYAMNCVQGHHHSEFGIGYWSNPTSLFWSMQVGCLVDDKSLAMAYNRLQLKRPILGCGLIIDSKPVLETMDL